LRGVDPYRYFKIWLKMPLKRQITALKQRYEMIYDEKIRIRAKIEAMYRA